MAGTRRQDQRARTRAVLMDAACALFEEHGYEGTTMRAIARRAEVGLGTIFNHFPDKAALLLAAFHAEIDREMAGALAAVPQGELPVRFVHVAGELYAYYRRRPRLSSVLVGQAMFQPASPGDPVSEQAQRFLVALADLVAQAQARGEIDREVQPLEGALCLWSDYLSVLVAGLRDPAMGLDAQLTVLRRLVDLRIGGLRPRQAQASARS